MRGGADLMGSFALMPLQEVVEFLARRRVSGLLSCERGAVRKSCQLVEGVIVEASSNDPREYLGQLLINFGHLGEQELARAFQQQQQTKVRLGRVLVQRGLVTPDVVRDTLAIKIRETLLDAFLWETGFFRVESASPRPADELDARVPLAEVAREAEFRASAWKAIRAAFPSGNATLVVDEARVPAGIDPESVNGRILRLAREGRSVDELALALHAPDFHLYQRLYALHAQGAVHAAPERPLASADADAPARLDDARAHLAAGRLGEAEEAADEALAMNGALAEAAELRDRARAALAERLGARFLSPPRRPALLVARHELPALPFGAMEKWLLAHCDGSRDVSTLVRLTPAPELEVLKALARFVDRRIVTVA